MRDGPRRCARDLGCADQGSREGIAIEVCDGHPWEVASFRSRTNKGGEHRLYVLTASDGGKTVAVKVTGSKPGYASVSKPSKKTKKVAA